MYPYSPFTISFFHILQESCKFYCTSGFSLMCSHFPGHLETAFDLSIKKFLIILSQKVSEHELILIISYFRVINL